MVAADLAIAATPVSVAAMFDAVDFGNSGISGTDYSLISGGAGYTYVFQNPVFQPQLGQVALPELYVWAASGEIDTPQEEQIVTTLRRVEVGGVVEAFPGHWGLFWAVPGGVPAELITDSPIIGTPPTPTNSAPTAVADGPFGASEDTARTFTAAQLVGNDTDPDPGDTLSVHSVGGATNGAVVLNTNGTVTFTPTANYQGPASFTYQVKDSKGAVSANTATVNLNVLAVNDAPTAVADGPFGASEDTARTFTAAQLVGNDTDPDKVYGDTLTVHSVGGATNGAVVLNTNGTVTFTPTANYQGPASFTYQVKDSKGAVSANTATVNLNVLAVNDAPTAVADGRLAPARTPRARLLPRSWWAMTPIPTRSMATP